MASQAFVDSVVKEIIQPGVNRLMELPYFTELRSGKLSTKRLQGWALQHYLHNVALLKGFALCMVKNSHDPDLFKYFLYQMNEEQYHPDLAKKFGLAIDLQEEDFANAMPMFECLSHTARPSTACSWARRRRIARPRWSTKLGSAATPKNTWPRCANTTA